jgi:hypothetical protein
MSDQLGYDLASAVEYGGRDESSGWLLERTAETKPALSDASESAGWHGRKSVDLWNLRRSTSASLASVREAG